MNAADMTKAAAVFLGDGNVKAAVGAAEAATLLAPSDALAWSALGNALAQNKQHERAVECFERAIQLDPEDVANYTSLGELLLDLGAYKQAAAALDTACKKDPAAAHPSGRRARVLIAKTLGALRTM